MNSLTEENYLKAIYKLLEKGKGEVSTNAIAAKVNTKAASVTDMLKKLADKKLINYKKYQGVTLTKKGESTAVAIIRKHRLWEVFLVEKLKFKWDEVHDMAEQLEHIQSDDLIKRLDNFLGNPRIDPHGDPIPDASGKFVNQSARLLSSYKTSAKVMMTGVVDHSSAFLKFLEKSGFAIGVNIHISKTEEYDKSLHITINNKHRLLISERVANNILARPL